MCERIAERFVNGVNGGILSLLKIALLSLASVDPLIGIHDRILKVFGSAHGVFEEKAHALVIEERSHEAEIGSIIARSCYCLPISA